MSIALEQEPPELAGPASELPQWPMRSGVYAVVAAIGGAVMLGLVLALIFAVAGHHDLDTPAFTFASTVAQEIAFVGAALIFAARTAVPRARDFGFRRFAPSALLWTLAAMVLYLTLAATYSAIFKPPQDDLPQSFGAESALGLAIATGVVVILIAPVVEEFFFRGFVYASFRNRLGVWPGALLSGLLFGAIHLKPVYLAPLAILGTVLALLYEKTGSIWPCILLHAMNNALAFALTI